MALFLHTLSLQFRFHLHPASGQGTQLKRTLLAFVFELSVEFLHLAAKLNKLFGKVVQRSLNRMRLQ